MLATFPKKNNSNSYLTRRELMKYGLYGGLATSLSPYLWINGCRTSVWGKSPNIILITVDTLRADHLGCYGYSRNTSPNIDQFANDSMLFEHCFSHAPMTGSSFASILSGFLPNETKVVENLPLPKEVPTLPATLQQHGYKTAAVVSNYVLRKKNGWAKGFMVYDDEMTNIELNRSWPERIAEHTTNRAIEQLKKFHKDKLFMWIHYQDPHGPYTPPERFIDLFQNSDQKVGNLRVNRSNSGQGGIPLYQKLGNVKDYDYYVSQYDREILYLDEQFKLLLGALKKYGLYDEDIIIFSADHGEGMGERNYYFAHGENLYNSQIHVPLIIKYGKELKGRRIDFVQHLDITPTILNVVGAKTNLRFRGTDLCRQDTKKKEIFSQMESPFAREGVKFSIMLDGLKLIHTQINRRSELFDLKADPHEEHDLFGNPNYQENAKDLLARLRRIINENFLGLHIVNKPRKMTKEEKEKLKSLGYLK